MLRPASRPTHYFTRGSRQWLSLIAIAVTDLRRFRPMASGSLLLEKDDSG